MEENFEQHGEKLPTGPLARTGIVAQLVLAGDGFAFERNDGLIDACERIRQPRCFEIEKPWQPTGWCEFVEGDRIRRREPVNQRSSVMDQPFSASCMNVGLIRRRHQGKCFFRRSIDGAKGKVFHQVGQAFGAWRIGRCSTTNNAHHTDGLRIGILFENEQQTAWQGGEDNGWIEWSTRPRRRRRGRWQPRCRIAMRGFLGWQDAGTERRREKRQSKGNSAAAKTIHSEMPAIRRSY